MKREHGARPGTPLAWYRWYPGDHLRVTRGWPLVARGAYRELLDAQWDAAGGVLPASPEDLRRIVGATVAEWRIAWFLCAPHFPRQGQARQNPALENLRITQEALVEKRRRAGLAGNRTRWASRATVVPLRSGLDDV
jgi:uncharacterized protein YdaU (DUF1376 family)